MHCESSSDDLRLLVREADTFDNAKFHRFFALLLLLSLHFFELSSTPARRSLVARQFSGSISACADMVDACPCIIVFYKQMKAELNNYVARPAVFH